MRLLFVSSFYLIATLLPSVCLAEERGLLRHEAHWGPGQCKSCKCWVDGVKLSDNADFNECGGILMRWVVKNKPDEKITSEPILSDKTLVFSGKSFRVIELATCKGDC